MELAHGRGLRAARLAAIKADIATHLASGETNGHRRSDAPGHHAALCPTAFRGRGYHPRELLQAASTAADPEDEAVADDATGSALATPCPCCGGRMIVIETFETGCQPSHAPTIRIDTS
jgi:hypothetical protein